MGSDNEHSGARSSPSRIQLYCIGLNMDPSKYWILPYCWHFPCPTGGKFDTSVVRNRVIPCKNKEKKVNVKNNFFRKIHEGI